MSALALPRTQPALNRLLIDNRRGPCQLRGAVEIRGAKNAALPALVATLLTDESVVLRGVPQVKDVQTLIEILRSLGADTSGDETLRLRTARILRSDPPADIVRSMRASILLLGALLARTGHARLALPGGCAIGQRPVDLHVMAMQALGAEVEVRGGFIEARVNGRLRGAEIDFPAPTVTGTENALLAAVVAEGATVMTNAATEPEVVDLCHLLRRMGARIDGEGTPVITVVGVASLHGADHPIIPDRIEAGTYVIAGALCGEDVEVRGCRPQDLLSLLSALGASGVPLLVGADFIRVRRPERLLAGDITTAPHPGFPTDLQAPYLTLLTQAHGTSVVREEIFENRFHHAKELCHMGAAIAVSKTSARVRGRRPLTGKYVEARDLRGAAALVLAGLCAAGQTVVSPIGHLDRGYQQMEVQLQRLGAPIERI